MESSRYVAPRVIRPNAILKFVRTYFIERTMWRIPRTEAVLDFCSGWGFYGDINPRASMIDGDEVAVADLRKRGFSGAVLGDVLLPLPFAPERFDWVLAHDVLEHFSLTDLRTIMSNVHSVLAPGGRFVVWVPNRPGYDFGLRIGAGHIHFVTSEDIASLIHDFFVVEKHYSEPLPRWLGRWSVHNKEVFFLRKV